VFPIKYKSQIKYYAKQSNLDAALVASVIRAESNFNPSATSNKGAVGLMQIMPATAEFIATENDIAAYDLKDPRDNIRLGTLYLRYLLNKFKDEKTAIMAYNAGEGNVARWLGESKRLSKTPYPETNAYTEKVLNAKNFYHHRF
jgi:soluble lytic murein transglycosylase